MLAVVSAMAAILALPLSEQASAQSRSALSARPANVPRLAMCHFPEDKDAYLNVPIFNGFHARQLFAAFARPAALAEPKADDEDDEDDDEEEDDTEEADPPVRNFIAVGSQPGLQRGPCYRISGTAAYSTILSDGTNPAGRLTRGPSQYVAKESRTTLGLQMIEDLPAGRFRAVMELDWSYSSGASSGSISNLWMSLGAFTAGLKGSTFDFWAGDEFAFKATAPSATTHLLSVALRTSENSTATFSAEDPTFRRLADNGYAGIAMPDVVARWKYEANGITIHAGGALHQLRFAAPNRTTRYGHAAILGVQKDVSSFGKDDYWIAQFVYANTAPGYLGIAQPGGLLRFTLPRNAPVFLLETLRGWTAALAYSHGWSEKWRSNAFATYVDMRLTEGPGRGKMQVGRAAINLVWSPVPDLDLTWELGVGRIYRLDTFRNLASYPSRPIFGAQWTIARKF